MKENKQARTPPPQQAPPKKATLPWSALEQQVVRMQKQITHACQRGDKQAVHALQQSLIESEAARLLAVRRVTEENQGKDTAGIDGVKSLNAKERLAMAELIHPRQWKGQVPQPVRRVWIPKQGTDEKRPLAILPIIDRCKQALVKLALEPEWEVQFETYSYGFRPGRSTHDAIAAIVVAIEGHPAFVFNADIENAFDTVNQAAVLEKLRTYPAMRQVIQAWLTAGIRDGTTFLPSEQGIAQGGVLSPLLMNVALHGMEAAVVSESNSYSRERPTFVRYADNFVILHSNLQELQRASKRVRLWLATLGLHLNARKTQFAHTLTSYQGQVGFDFLGFNIRQESVERNAQGRQEQERLPRLRTLLAPSEEAIQRHMATLDARLEQLSTAPQARVIRELNPLIAGWSTYYNGFVPATALRHYDDVLEQKLLRWAARQHRGKDRNWLLTRYWHTIGKQPRVFSTDDGMQLRRYEQMSVLRES